MKIVKYIAVLCAIIFSTTTGYASTLSKLLNNIENNNTELKSLRDDVKARKLANRTGISLEDPEVEYDYLWGNPSSVGHRIGISFSQKFDIATISGQKSRVADAENRLVDIEYAATRMDILVEAQQLYIDAVYWNTMIMELERRVERARTIASASKALLESGEGNIIEKNSAAINCTTAEAELAVARVEFAAVLSELTRLNGGVSVVLETLEYQETELPANFDTWFASVESRWPSIKYAQAVTELSHRRVKLNRSEGLPTISAGFLRERVDKEAFTGMSFGLSIPIWQNRNRVKQAKAAEIAARSHQAQSRQQLYDNLRTLYGKASGLKAVAASYDNSLNNHTNVDLLRKAFEAGELSIIQYIIQTEYYYSAYDRMVEALRDYRKACVSLLAVDNL